MSLREYPGGWAHHRSHRVGSWVTWTLAALAVTSQIAYPLCPDEWLPELTRASVVLFFLASASHAWVFRGVLWAGAMVGVTVGGGLLAEAAGLRTGYPFGAYQYSEVLGLQVLGVPLVVPLAWSMMAYPVYVVATTLSRSRFFAALIGGWTLMAWDLFLDPMMIELGAWSWDDPARQVPGIEGVPLQNFAGWFAVGTVMMAVLLYLPRRTAPVGQPATLFLWVWLSSALGAAAFFDRPSVAVIGGVAMGVVALPFAWRLWADRI